MKVVKFKNGMYGVRKGNWWSGYQFAINFSGKWERKSTRFIQEFPNHKVREVFAFYVKIESRNNDMGK